MKRTPVLSVPPRRRKPQPKISIEGMYERLIEAGLKMPGVEDDLPNPVRKRFTELTYSVMLGEHSKKVPPTITLENLIKLQNKFHNQQIVVENPRRNSSMPVFAPDGICLYVGFASFFPSRGKRRDSEIHLAAIVKKINTSSPRDTNLVRFDQVRLFEDLEDSG
ncbi:hypothetical protein H6775_00405 [Candidatus Nomurabacteria bacterium]|nr:hypothetical protein [Candidatus Nomurabacteria bacterium]